MPRSTGKKAEGEKTYIKGIGFCGNGIESNVSEIDVKDGKIIRIRPLHYDREYNPEEFNPWKMEAHGKTFEPLMKTLIPPLSMCYKKRIYSPNRILYPLKRVDFDPNGERNMQNRGKSGFVRISWDEALEIIVSEIRRIHKEYGPYGILTQGEGHGQTKVVQGAHGYSQQLLKLLGGYSQHVRNADSWEGWCWGGKHVWGMEPMGQMMPATNVMIDIAENSGMLLHWGCDAETTTWGWGGQISSRLMYWFTEVGVKQVFICPDLNYSAAIHGDKWIPVLPNTDAALQLAIAYIWITEGTYDKDYVATHTYGFEQFADYVLGKEDGVAKTPKWAAELCGVSSRTIKALARKWASTATTIGHCNGGSYIRGPYSHEPARLEILLLAMQGLGKPGTHQVKFIEGGLFGLRQTASMPFSIISPTPGAAFHGQVIGEYPKQFVPKPFVHKAILEPPISWYGISEIFLPADNQLEKYTYPVEGCPEFHMMWTDTPCFITCWNGGNEMTEAFRSPKIEFILAQHPWLENDCLFADIVLPVSTKFEEKDMGVDILSGQFDSIFHEEKCIEPLGEAKSEYEIVCMIAERMGLLEELTGGKSVDECIKDGFENSGVEGYISHEEWKEKGYYVVPTDPEWENCKVGMIDFYEDPEGNPLGTPTGKIEFCSTRLAEHFPDDKERPPVPHWVPYGETHQESLLCERAKKYPLLMESNHPRWSIHAQHEDVTWFREIPTCKVKGPDGYLYHPVWIHPKDAAARGIEHGDIVKIYNDRGGVLAGAYVTERIMPGAVSSDHGAKYDPIVRGELDRGGANNTIAPSKTTSKNVTGMATSGFLVEVERVNLDELRRQYPEAFERKFHPTAGLSIDSFAHKG